MFHKHNADKDFETMRLEDEEAKGEFLRQRDFLEQTVHTLQAQVISFLNVIIVPILDL